MAISLRRCFFLWIIGFGVIGSLVVSELHNGYYGHLPHLRRAKTNPGYPHQPFAFMRKYYHLPKPRSELANFSPDYYQYQYYGRPRFFHLQFDHSWNFSLDIG